VVVAACRPDGQVRLGSELWNAACAGGAEIGDPVRVTAVDGLMLVVVPLPKSAAR
jgi:membrane protein implicated in regulation of membrane protease activity